MILGFALVGIGCIEIFFPGVMERWDHLVGRGPSTQNTYKILGMLSIMTGIVVIVGFTFFTPLSR